MVARIYLYVPGGIEHKLAKAVMSSAGAVIADLEDAVALDAKAQAREIVAAWLTDRAMPEVERWVRVNPGEVLKTDVAVLAGRSLAGIVVPKVSSREEVDSAVAVLGAVGLHRVAVIPLIETAASLSHLHDIAAAPRVY